MKKIFLFTGSIFIFLFVTAQKNDPYIEDLKAYQKNYVAGHEVVPKKDKKHFHFFPISKAYQVTGYFEKINDTTGFTMNTSAGTLKHYYKYGRLDFIIDGKECRLYVYQSKDLMLVENTPAKPNQLYGTKLRDMIKNNVAHEIRFAFLVEQLPDPENRIVPAYDQLDSNGMPRPKLYYKLDDCCKAGIKIAIDTQKLMLDSLGCTQQHHSAPWGAGHIVGTTRMGDDPKTSVVSKDLRSHDHKNLFILGSNTFPTVAASNPTLTIAALSLRAVETIQKQLLDMP